MDEKGFFDLDDFIQSMTKSIQCRESEMLLQDIIMIYNGCYGDAYGDYLEKIEKANEKVRDMRRLDSMSFTTELYFTPYHSVLEEFQFNYIQKLRGLYENNRKD